jgi:serine protease Do
MSRFGRWAASGAAGAVLLGAIGVGTTLYNPAKPGRVAAAVVPNDPECAASTNTLEGLSQVFRCASHAAMPSVVYVEVESDHATTTRGRQQDPFEGTPFEGMAPGFGTPQQQGPSRGSGSGFVFREGGYILTNNHVVDGADRVTVITQDRRQLDARVIGRDPNTDVAVIKVEANDLPVASLGDSENVDVGDWVVALGYPLGLGATVTSGIISAKGRDLGILRQDESAQAPVEYYLQTDAAINPGNSGGPLVDLRGHVVGMNSAIASPTGYFSGYGFAVPINIATRVASDLIEYGSVHRARLGVGIKDATPADADVYKLDHPAGAVVSQVPENSPAGNAGIELGDVIVGIDGQPIVSAGDLIDRVTIREPGEKVKLDVVRYGRHMNVEVKLGTFENAVTVDPNSGHENATGIERLGFSVSNLTPELAHRLGIERSANGAVVTNVDPSSSAAQAGLKPGLVIEKVNGKEVGSVADVDRAMAGMKEAQAVSLIVSNPQGEDSIINFIIRD